ncbi:MAG: hypothetical protein HUU60_03655 [Armatimonadetes bacterium]|nr:hypothetical protein [Armatimonadota bacterium]
MKLSICILLSLYFLPAYSQQMASADFNGDGIQDVAFVHGASVRVQLGNPGAIFPHLGGGSDPFLPHTVDTALPFAPELVASGDFDADGRTDIVCGKGSELLWLSGNGGGAFAISQRSLLSGTITALASGDANRRDSLADLLIGIDLGQSFELYVYEGPEGAMRAIAERVRAPGRINAIAPAQFDDKPWIDIACATDEGLFVVFGRDRMLSHGGKSGVLPAQSKLVLNMPLTAMAPGRFANGGDYQIATVSVTGDVRVVEPDGSIAAKGRVPFSGDRSIAFRARITANEYDDLVVCNFETGEIVVARADDGKVVIEDVLFELGLRAALPMRLNPTAFTDIAGLTSTGVAALSMGMRTMATFTVNLLLDLPDGDITDGICDTGNATSGFTGVCTLRAAIMQINALAGSHAINFAVTGGLTYEPFTNLPDIVRPVFIDGSTQPGGENTPIIEIDGHFVSGLGNGLTVPSDSVVRGLIITNFNRTGLTLSGSHSFVEGNYVGIDRFGSGAKGNGRATEGLGGIVVLGSNNVIGGLAGAARNVIADNGNAGVMLDGGFRTVENNRVQGNYLGLDATGMVSNPDGVPGNADDLGNTIGVVIVGATARNNTVGGLAEGARNVVAGSEFNSVRILNGASNLVQGNLLGSNRDESQRMGAGFSGVFMADALNNTLGGTVPAARNLVVGNGVHGVFIQGFGPATGNQIQGNHIGTNADGSFLGRNIGNGVRLEHAANNIVGGTVEGAMNVIGMNAHGVEITGNRASGNRVEGNRIGVVADGINGAPNTGNAIQITNAPNNIIGGNGADARNILSNNFGHGVAINGAQATGNQILGNYIGVAIDGQTRLANLSGVVITGAPNNFIGASTNDPGTPPGNVVSGNQQYGVLITGNGAGFNQVAGNVVGTGANGVDSRPNGFDGIAIINAPDSLVSPGQTGERNIIANNGRSGVLIEGAQALRNKIMGNYIGLNKAGDPAPNATNGIFLKDSRASEIGGAGVTGRNIVSNHSGIGVLITGGGGHVVRNNHIGVNISGNAAMPNLVGVRIDNSSGNSVGVAQFDGGNVISGNTLDGIEITGDIEGIQNSGGNAVVLNSIGTDITGTMDLGNGLNGVRFRGISEYNTVGGVFSTHWNRIAFNNRNGVTRPLNNRINGIIGNRIYNNDDLGIDVGDDGVTPNDDPPEDNIVNFPVVLSAIFTGTDTVISGRLTALPETGYAIYFYSNVQCDPGNHGEGRQPLAILEDLTDANGILSFSVDVDPGLAPVGSLITTTASRRHFLPVNFLFFETSEFSRCTPVIIRIPGDVNLDGCVDDVDLALVLTAFGQTGSGLPEDLNNDGAVDDTDLALVLENFGLGC